MPAVPFLLIVTVAAALAFDYTTGAHPAAAVIAPVISTRVLPPKTAVIMVSGISFAGALLGTRVAETLGEGIVHPAMARHFQSLTLAAVLGAVGWNLLTRRLGLPSSTTHALVGGLIGAGVVKGGWGVLQVRSIAGKVIVPLVASPMLGFVAGYLLMVGLAWLTWNRRHRRTDRVFRRLQLLTAVFMSMSHASNSAQKTMGLITLSLFTFGMIPAVVVPLWVKLACAGAMAIGTVTGGWRVIRTTGGRIFRLRAVHGFAAETAAGLVISSASMFGAPISTVHVISSSVLGTGSAHHWQAVNWAVGRRMASAWLLTIPAAAAVGAGCMCLLGLMGV